MSKELKIEQARRILEDKLFQESVEALKQQLVSEWGTTNQHDVDSREQIWLELKLVDRFVGHLTAIFEEGQITKFTSTMREI